MTLEEKIELFFFDPNKSRSEYSDYYKKINLERFLKEKNRCRISPLYLLLKDIRYCYAYGKEFNPVRKNINPPELAGIVLLRIAFTNTVRRIYSGRFIDFARDYMNITDPDNVKALSLLRNALEHSYYTLSTYKDGVKIYFAVGYYDCLIEKDKNWKRPYKSELYWVNPKRLFISFEKGIEKLKDDLKNHENKKLRNNFEKNLSLDQWLIFQPHNSL